MDHNQRLQDAIAFCYPEEDFGLVRHTYLLEDITARKVNLVIAENTNFPSQFFAESWQLFSTGYYYDFLYADDVIRMAKGDVDQFTSLNVPVENIHLFALQIVDTEMTWNDGAVFMQPPSPEDNAAIVKLLNIFYHVELKDCGSFRSRSDDFYADQWLTIGEALEKLQVQADITCLKAFQKKNKHSQEILRL